MKKEEKLLTPEVHFKETAFLPSSCLVVAPAWIGDMVMAQSLFKYLKVKNPGIIIDVLAPSWTFPLLERMPEVRRGILFPFQRGEFRPMKRYAFAKQLRYEDYRQAYVLTNSFKSALVPFWAKIPVRIGWIGESRYGLLNDARRLDKAALPLMVQQFIALGQTKEDSIPSELAPYYPELSVDFQRQEELLIELQLKLDKPVIALCPGAEYGESKRWPSSHFAKIAKALLSEGWQVWILGAPKDAVQSDIIHQETKGQCVNLVGKTSLRDAVDLLSLVKIVLCNDSGLMHIAAALNKPLVVLYGSSSPQFTPPLTRQVKILSLGLDCSPCYQRTCSFGHYDCLKQLSPEYVLSNLKSLIKHETNTDN